MISKNNKATIHIIEDLDTLLKKRNGGAINFRGIQYQILYSCHLILKNLFDSKKNENITLEGLEDIDHKQITLTTNSSELIQLKSSDNKINAGDFWTMNVLQNFLQVYLVDESSNFKLVYNFKVADGALRQLFEKKLTDNSLQFWQSKLYTYSDIHFDVKDFLNKIAYQRMSFDEISTSITQLLFKNWNVNTGTERQFVNALVNNVLQWSKERKTINHQNVLNLFEDINESYSKAVKNEAVKNNWIERVNYSNESSSDLLTYYDGKSAKPYHISNGLPAQRKFWEKKIIEALKTNDAVLIRSSSGQGKSTLAWQVGYLLKEKYNIYQLHSSKTWEQADSSMEFLQSRIAIGEFPIVIIDGLDSEVDHWQVLVQRTSALPIRFIITARHEDWNRFGADISNIGLEPIDISMSKEEAEDIFKQFKQKGKLHKEVKDWQSIWEQVFKKGLLIEYTYLLTRGEMIKERLSKQIQKLKDDRSPAAKTEILRIVAAADCLQLRIGTQNLIHHIETFVTFSNQDRGEVLLELQNEYFLNFDGKKIEGLHPIRSKHLLQLLHEIVPLSSTLKNLYQLLDEQDKQNFFRNTSLLLKNEDCKEFYSSISQILGKGPYIDMVYALNGASHAEPQKYWLKNQEQFDEVYNTGGLDLFIINTIPGKKLNTLDKLIKILPPEYTDNISRQTEILKTLSDYNFEDSEVMILAKALLEVINTSNSCKSSYKGLGHLAKWYKKLNLKLILPFEDQVLSEGLKNQSITDVKGLFQFMHISNPRAYERYVNENKLDIINYLRKATDSLSITENKSHIYIQYLYDADSVIPSNEESVTRLESIYILLPFYEKYNIEAILLPFPTEEIISVIKSDSSKSMVPENIPDSSEASYSNIWIDTISRNYDENSAFQWQKKIMEMRNNAIEWCKSTLRIIDSTIEGNLSKRTKELQPFVLVREKLGRSIVPRKTYPRYEYSTAHNEDRKKFEKLVNNWFDTVRNSDSQFINLFNPKGENDQNLASINLKAIFFKLKEMQTAFHNLEKLTTAHFDSLLLDKNEDVIYERLYKSVIYYMNHLPINDQVPVKIGRIAIENWYNQFQSSEMFELKKILENASSAIGYNFILPKRILKTETYASVVVGINDFDFNQEDAIMSIAQGLFPFADYPAAFFTVIAIKNNFAVGGLRFKRYFFELMRNFDESKIDELNRNLPLPVIPDAEVAELLEIETIEQDSKSPSNVKYKILMEVWKLSKTRSLLNKNDFFENKWLGELEEKYLDSIEKGFNLLPHNANNNKFIHFVRNDCSLKKIWSDQDIISFIVKVLQEETNASYNIL